MPPFLDLAHALFTVTMPGKRNVMVVCPFHLNREGVPERTGSLSFNVENGLWFCHTCAVGGGLRKLLRRMGQPEDMVDPGVMALAEQAAAPEARPLFPDLTFPPGLILPEETLGLFDTRPKVPAETKRWGLKASTVFHFDIGYDPRNLRVTFPLRDFMGNLVGFSGRALTDHPARYKVYGELEYEKWKLPSLPPAAKGKIIWNYDQVSAALERTWDADILVTEGFKACAWLWQLGFPYTVALLGSNMSEQQQAMLERLGGTLYLFLDNDKAGEKKHLIGQRLASAGCDVRIPTYPTRQPDELKRPQVVEAMRDAALIYPAEQPRENH